MKTFLWVGRMVEKYLRRNQEKVVQTRMERRFSRQVTTSTDSIPTDTVGLSLLI